MPFQGIVISLQRSQGQCSMYAQIAASLRHLKQAVIHLHDAKLIIAGLSQSAAEFIDTIIRATRAQVKELEASLSRPEE